MALTPMMKQYLEIKAQYQDAILFFRLGDFYEMFFEDANLASKELDITLTSRDCGEGERAPMCGVPYHSVDPYIGKLVSKGYKVVICEQMEEASPGSLVRRDIARIVTPGTVIDSALLNETQNNYLCAAFIDANGIGLSFADISTAEVRATSFSGDNAMVGFINELGVYKPSEIILNCDINDFPKLKEKLDIFVNDKQSKRFDYNSVKDSVKKQFDREIEDKLIVSSLGALLGYTAETQKIEISYIKNLIIYSGNQFLEIDLNTRRNLELCETMRNKEKRGSLLWVLDKTRTSMGARLLRKWLEQPLVNVNMINRRQNAVAELFDNFMTREDLADLLKNVTDLERIMTKVVYGTANGRDLRSIAATISVIPRVKAILEDIESVELRDIFNNLDDLDDIKTLIENSIIEEPPFSVREGGFIKLGFDARLDGYKSIMTDSQGCVDRIEAAEREKTGIRTLKVGYNRVFGYYIEVTKSYTANVPDSYIRKQTLANCERYITPELKDIELTLLGASDKAIALEYDIFTQVREKIAADVSRIQESAAKLALFDVYVSLADVAVKNGYTKPYVDYGDTIKIKDGRHPVVELFAKDSTFVPNDTVLDTNNNRLLLITGPNMAGKSTYMRQVAIISIMAQIGSFVPAADADVGIVDKIFTRVGASDDLASGQSTFMLEMNEVAYILKNATNRSLIIYDEIGRGTSTFDGMSIARAVAEYTQGKKLGAKTLFATHYHELTELESLFPGVVNYNIAAKKRSDDLIFLRKIIRGAADDSYGIEVAKLAGVPNEIIKRAREVLTTLESQVNTPRSVIDEPENQNITFEDFNKAEVIDKLKRIDVNLMSPMEALNFLAELKKILS